MILFTVLFSIQLFLSTCFQQNLYLVNIEIECRKTNPTVVSKPVGVVFPSDSFVKNHIKIEWKVRLCEHLTIWLTNVADAESFGNHMENRIVLLHLLKDHNLRFKIYCGNYRYSSPNLIKPSSLQWKIDLRCRIASLEGDNLVVFYNLSASEMLC